MFAFNPPEFLVKFVAGVGPVVVVSLLGALVTLAALILLVPKADRLGLIDKPNHRKRHGTPTPMVGGLAIFLGLAASLSVATPLDNVFPFMVAAGLLTGEAFFGTESSILSFVDSLWYDDNGDPATIMGVENFPNSKAWYGIRMASLILINVVVGAAIYYLFKRAGVIGGDASTTKA